MVPPPYVDADRTRGGELRLDEEKQGYEYERYDNYCRDGSEYCIQHMTASLFKVKYP